MSGLEKAIVIVGAISSGKSTIAKRISDQHKIQVASFGGYLKDHCLQNNLPVDRKSLQDTGERFISSMPETFLLEVIHFSGHDLKSLIFEGVRHRIIFELLRKHSGHMFSIFLDVPYEVRKERYLLRNKDIDSKNNLDEFDLVNSHHVELDIPNLASQCNLIVSSLEDTRLHKELSSFIDS